VRGADRWPAQQARRLTIPVAVGWLCVHWCGSDYERCGDGGRYVLHGFLSDRMERKDSVEVVGVDAAGQRV
jgi:hypothetical protein